MAWGEQRGNGEFPWRAVFRIGTKPDGSPLYDQEPGFATREAAVTYGRNMEADARRGRYHNPKAGDITVEDYFWKLWLPAQDLSDESKRRREGEFRAHIGPRWGKGTLNSINTFEIGAFEVQLKKKLAQSTRKNVMDLLRFMLDDAVHAKLLQESPMLPRQRTRRGTREALQTRPGMVTTIDNVFAICERLRPDYAFLVLITLFTGMRWGEVAGIRRSLLTLNPATATAPASGEYVIDPLVGAVHTARTGRRFLGPPKNNKGRTVRLPPFLVEMLLAWLATMPEGQDLLFVNRKKEPLSHQIFDTDQWRPACDGWPERPHANARWYKPAAAPIQRGLRLHDLRHTLKTWLAEGGVEPRARDEHLGHATPGMDGVYVHTTPAMWAKLIDLLQSLWEAAIGDSPPPIWTPKHQ